MSLSNMPVVNQIGVLNANPSQHSKRFLPFGNQISRALDTVIVVQKVDEFCKSGSKLMCQLDPVVVEVAVQRVQALLESTQNKHRLWVEAPFFFELFKRYAICDVGYLFSNKFQPTRKPAFFFKSVLISQFLFVLTLARGNLDRNEDCSYRPNSLDKRRRIACSAGRQGQPIGDKEPSDEQTGGNTHYPRKPFDKPPRDEPFQSLRSYRESIRLSLSETAFPVYRIATTPPIWRG